MTVIKLPRKAKKAFINRLNRGEYIAFRILGEILLEEGNKRNVFKNPPQPKYIGDFEDLYIFRKIDCLLRWDNNREKLTKKGRIDEARKYAQKVNEAWKVITERHSHEAILPYVKGTVFHFHLLRIAKQPTT